VRVARESRRARAPAGRPRDAIDENVVAMEDLIPLGRKDRAFGRAESR
jgi:hypothetical protein